MIATPRMMPMVIVPKSLVAMIAGAKATIGDEAVVDDQGDDRERPAERLPLGHELLVVRIVFDPA